MMPRQGTCAATACVLALAVAQGVFAQAFTFTKLVDSNASVPNGTGTFGDTIGIPPFLNVAFSQGHTYFVGRQQGIYEAFGGNVSRVADYTTPVPGGTGTFRIDSLAFSRPVGSSGNIAFDGSDGTVAGIYSRVAGTLGVVVDTNTNAAGGGQFRGFGSFGIDGSTVAFDSRYGTSAQFKGVFKKTGSTITTIADATTAIPNGTGTFTNLQATRLDTGLVTFHGQGSAGQEGIYRHDGTNLSRLVDLNTPAPGGFAFTSIGVPYVDAADTAFQAGYTGPGSGGLFTRKNGTIELVVDAATPLPGGGSLSNGFANISIGDGWVVFGTGQRADVYTNAGGTIQKILAPGDVLDGKTVSEAFNFRHGQDGSEVALLVRFEGMPRYEAIYSVTVPAIGGLAPMVPVTLLAFRRHR